MTTASKNPSFTTFVVVSSVFVMIEQLLAKWVLAGLFIVAVAVYCRLVTVREERRIKKLGGRGVVVSGWLPFGKACPR